MRKALTIVVVMMSITCLSKNWQGKEINLTDSIRHYQQKLNAFPDNVQVTEEYLDAALSLCMVCLDADSIALGEQTASTALVRGSILADSCWQAAALFSMLAYFYEQRGDSIMPEHFHGKSQVLMIRNSILKYHADSVVYYNRRFDDLINMRHQQKHLFSRKNRNYAFLADDYCAMVSDSGNTLETIHVGEQLLQLVRDSAFLSTEDVCSETYFRLIYAHAMSGHTERALTLIDEARSYYSRFPKEWATETMLWWQLGDGLFLFGDYANAIKYLQKAKKLCTKADKHRLERITNRIKLCKKKL